MKLFINTTSLQPPLTGIGNYTLNLIQHLRDNPDIEQITCFNGHDWQPIDHQLALVNDAYRNKKLSNRNSSQLKSQLRKFIRSMPFSYSIRNRVIKRNFNNLRPVANDAIYHEPNFILKSDKFPSVVNIHDLSFIHYPQYHPRQRVHWLRKELPKTLSQAHAIITDSYLVRDELLQRYKIKPERVTAIHLGVDARFMPRPAAEVNAFLNEINLNYKQYVLYVGTIEPRKAIDVLLASWLALPKSTREQFPLVIAGSPGWGCAKLMTEIKALAEKGDIRYLQYVDHEDLPTLYAGAAIFVYPSLYEGFGLPVLEAMASGTTVICHAKTTMAEFADKAAVLCETQDIEEWATKLKAILDDRQLNERLAADALTQAQNYSWRQCAEQTLTVYKQLIDIN